MPLQIRAVVFACALALLSGCVAPRQAMRDLPNPQSLDAVNELLAGATVTVELTDGRAARNVAQVSVAADSVRYLPRRAARRLAVPTAEVVAITRVRGRGTRYGAAIGTIPGLLVIYSGIKESGSRRRGQQEAASAGLAISVPALIVGAAFGAWLGQLTTPGETVTLYRAPVSRYAPAARSPSPSDR